MKRGKKWKLLICRKKYLYYVGKNINEMKRKFNFFFWKVVVVVWEDVVFVVFVVYYVRNGFLKDRIEKDVFFLLVK